ncbi:MAG TPA: DUF1501 domain-containing protein [Solirubrobacter sp.]|nr:DUF1501 domain-containing protein [Solirubrobacter sp.]
MRCIECEEIELARVRDARPTQTLPIPYAALDGFPAGRRATDLTRRRLLQWGVAGFASVYAAKELTWDTVWNAVAEAADAPEETALVLIYLAGGNDGLNVILPNGAHPDMQEHYSAYADARPSLHRGVGATAGGRVGSLPLTGPGDSPHLAFANTVVSGAANNGDAAAGFDTLYAASNLAVMPAVDALKYNLSHFDNSDIWFEAGYDLNTKTGWLGRWIDRHGSADNPLQAISIDTALSKSIRTTVNPVCAISSLPMAGFRFNSNGYGGVRDVDLNPTVNELAEVGASNVYLDRSRATYGLTTAIQGQLGAQVTTPVTYPNNGTLSTRLRTAAHMLASLPTRIVTIHWGGFDTHTNQLNNQDRQLKEFSRALAAFQADLTARGIDQRVATLVFSEFGRRVKETPDTSEGANDAGTDHGAGGLMLALGTKVRGGLASEWPGCRVADLVPSNPGQGNLKVPTDFRSVYRSVLAEWLGDDDPDGLIGGGAIGTLVRGDGQYATENKLFQP